LFDVIEGVNPDYALDVVKLCCEFSEDSFEAVASNYSIDIEGMSDDEIEREVVEYLQDNTSVVGTTANSIVYALF